MRRLLIGLSAVACALCADAAGSLVVDPAEYQFTWNSTYPATDARSSCATTGGAIDTGAFTAVTTSSSLLARYRTKLETEGCDLKSTKPRGFIIIAF